jgi:hypothetical protein
MYASRASPCDIWCQVVTATYHRQTSAAKMEWLAGAESLPLGVCGPEGTSCVELDASDRKPTEGKGETPRAGGPLSPVSQHWPLVTCHWFLEPSLVPPREVVASRLGAGLPRDATAGRDTMSGRGWHFRGAGRIPSSRLSRSSYPADGRVGPGKGT